MNAQEYNNLIGNYDPSNEEQRKAFEKITYRYPYFQSAYAHYLKSLKVQEQYNYNLILKKTSVLSPDRALLHHWLEDNQGKKSTEIDENKTSTTPEETQKTPPENPTTVKEKVKDHQIQ